MTCYAIKNGRGIVEFLEVVSQTDATINVRIIRKFDGYDQTLESSMDRHLFELCLRTGYLNELTEAHCSVA